MTCCANLGVLKESQCRKNIVNNKIVSKGRAIAKATLALNFWRFLWFVSCSEPFRQEHCSPNPDGNVAVDKRKSH